MERERSSTSQVRPRLSKRDSEAAAAAPAHNAGKLAFGAGAASSTKTESVVQSPAPQGPLPPWASDFPELITRELSPQRMRKLPQTFKKIHVAGEPPPVVKPKKNPVKQPLDAHMAAARLRLFVFDRTTGEPIHGAALRVSTVTSINEGGDRDVAKAFGNLAYSREDGVCHLKLLANSSYVITATCPGFHKYGELGEYLLVTPKENERVDKAIGMVPVRITIALTLRELRPMAGSGLLNDPYGQVNPLYETPVVDKMSTQPQKVSFLTPQGVKQTFLATTLLAHDVLSCAGEVPQPAATAYLKHKHAAESHATLQLDGGDGDGDGAADAPAAGPAEAQALAPVGAGGDVALVPGGGGRGAELVDGQGRVWAYSTDSEGHCYFYGPRVDAGRRGAKVPMFKYIDSGPWLYAKKRHMETNFQSLPQPLFEIHPATLQDNLRAAESRSPSRPGATDVPLSGEYGPLSANHHYGQPRRTRVGSPGRTRAGDGSLFTLRPAAKRGWLDLHPEIDGMIQAPEDADGAAADGAPRAPPPAWDTTHQSSHGGSPALTPTRRSMAQQQQQQQPEEVDEAAQFEQLLRDEAELDRLLAPLAAGREDVGLPQDGAWDESTAAFRALLASMGAMPMDPEGIHNYLFPGDYDLRLLGGDKALVFYTYATDTELSEVTRAQSELVKITMPAPDEELLAPHVEGTAHKRTTFPVQLYCRAKPWFQIVVYDVDTGVEVGQPHNMHFEIKRMDYTRSMTYRVARMQALFQNMGTQDPSQLPAGLVDQAALDYLHEQEQESRLSGLWAKAQLQEAERDSAAASSSSAKQGALRTTAGTGFKSQASTAEEDMDALLVPFAQGRLDEEFTRNKLFMTPGDTYSVSILTPDPFVEVLGRQTRQAGWELEPFVFYASHKVKFMAGCRERFSGDAIRGMRVHCVVKSYPKPPLPPTVRPEWCEEPSAYARRLIDTLIDGILQQRAADSAVAVVTEHWATTGEDGIATFFMPPGAEVTVTCEVGELYEETNSTVTRTLSREREQFSGFLLERIAFTRVSVLDCKSGESVPGFAFKAYDVTHLVSRPPEAGIAVDKTGAVKSKSSRKSSRNLKATRRFQLEDEELEAELLKCTVKDLKPIHVGDTSAEGAPPVKCRAGKVIKLIVTHTPREYLLPEYLKAGSGATLVYCYDEHDITFLAPPKPRLKVRCSDACTNEWVHGVRVLVMAHRVEAPYVPEGEAKSPQELHLEPGKALAPTASNQQQQQQGADEVAVAKEAAAQKPPADAAAGAGSGAAANAAKAPAAAEDAAAKGKAEEAGAKPPAAAAPGKEGVEAPEAPKRQEEAANGTAADPAGSTGRGAAGQPVDGKPQVFWDGKPVPANASAAASAGSRLSPEQLQQAVTQQVQALTDQALAASRTPVHPGNSTGVGTAAQGAAPSGASAGGPPALLTALATGSSVAAGGGGGATASSGPNTRTSKTGGKQDGGQGRPGGFAYAPSEHSSALGGEPAALGSEASAALAAQEEQEEERQRALEPSPVGQPLWGPIWYDVYTGIPDMEPEGPGLLLDVGLEMTVQVLPDWPYLCPAQSRSFKQGTWKSPKPLNFVLPRDDAAFRFWMERDRVLHTFYGPDGLPQLPYHPLARLQPHCPLAHLLGRYHPDLKLLKPPVWREGSAATEPNQAQSTAAAASAATPADQASTPAASAAGAAASREAKEASVAPASREPPAAASTTASGSAPGPAAAGAGAGSSKAALPAPQTGSDEPLPLQTCPSAIQFMDGMPDLEDVTAAAWEHMRMAGSQFLPLERTRLLALLAKWGAFPHILGGSCRACHGAQPSPSHPFLMLEHKHHGFKDNVSTTTTSVQLSSAGERELRTGYRSALLADDKYQLAAAWAVRPRGGAKQLPPHLKYHTPDKFTRTHAIMSRSEAIYCEVPFFTWRFPSGAAMHVGVNELLYNDLIGLLDRTASSLEFLTQHIARVKAHNETRGKQGRFLVGHEAADGCKGGLFVLDVSRAQPFGVIEFVLDQIGALWDWWGEVCGAPAPKGEDDARHQTTSLTAGGGGAANGTAAPASNRRNLPVPKVGLMVVAGAEALLMNSDGLWKLTTQGGNKERLKEWWEKNKERLPQDTAGFRMPDVLRKGLALAAGQVPVYLIAGGLMTRVRGTQKRISRVLYEAQLACIEKQLPLQPIHAIEFYPMPKLKKKRKHRGGSTAASQAGISDSSGAESGNEGEPGAKAELGPDGLAAEVSFSETAQGADVFEQLQDAMAAARVRLVDVFREVAQGRSGGCCGKNCCKLALAPPQLMRLVQRFLPNASPGQLRYLLLLLSTGESGATCGCTGTGGSEAGSAADGKQTKITYKELSTALKAANKTSMAVPLEHDLGLNLLLQRLGLMCIIKNVMPREVFDRFDTNGDGYLDQVEQWRMLKELFPCIEVHEQQELFAAVQEMDTNADERISWEEFRKAFAAGGVQQMQAWGEARDPEEMRRANAEKGKGGRDDVAVMAARADQEAKEMREVRKAGYPLTELLANLAGSTHGTHRRLDLGHGRAAADVIPIEPLERQKGILERSLRQLCDFEAAYGKAMGDLLATRSDARPVSPAPGGGGGALVSMTAPSASAVARKARQAASSDGAAAAPPARTARSTSPPNAGRTSHLKGVSGAQVARQRAQAEAEAQQRAAYGPPAAERKARKPRPASASRAAGAPRPPGDPAALLRRLEEAEAQQRQQQQQAAAAAAAQNGSGSTTAPASEPPQPSAALLAWQAGSGPQRALDTANGVGPWDGAGQGAPAPHAPGEQQVPARREWTKRQRPGSAPPARSNNKNTTTIRTPSPKPTAPAPVRPLSARAALPTPVVAPPPVVRKRPTVSMGSGRFGIMSMSGPLASLDEASLAELTVPVPGGPVMPPGELVTARRQGPGGFRGSIVVSSWATGTGSIDPQRLGGAWH